MLTPHGEPQRGEQEPPTSTPPSPDVPHRPLVGPASLSAARTIGQLAPVEPVPVVVLPVGRI